MDKKKLKRLFFPYTPLGRWSVGLIIIFFLLFLLMRLLVLSGQRGGETISDNLVLAIPGVLMGISGVSAFFTGIIGIMKNKERSFPVFMSTAVGLFILWFLIGELLIPH